MTEPNEPTPAPLSEGEPSAPPPAADVIAVADGDPLLDHSYDGIQEYDNPLPGWWSGVFIATIVFSVVYLGYYHFGPGALVQEEYQADAAAQKARVAEAAGPTYTDEALRALTEDPTAVAGGAQVYQTRCLPCHGDKGQGLIGPNLCDTFWIHGGKPTEIHTTVRVGVPAKGMIAWDKMLTPTEIAHVTAFVLTLQGTNPPGAKAPEGKEAE